MYVAKCSLLHFLKPVNSPCFTITLMHIYQQPCAWEGIIPWLCSPCCAPGHPSAGAGSCPGSKRLCHQSPPRTGQSCGPAERPIHHCPWGLGTQSQGRRSLKHAPLSFPDPQTTALCSDRFICTRQALFQSTKLGRWYQAVPAQKLELKTLRVVTDTAENHHCPYKGLASQSDGTSHAHL